MLVGSVERLFADDFTAGGQRDWATGGRGRPGGEHWQRFLLGQLRFDVLVAKAVVVSDVHVLDGPFFLRTSPSRLLSSIGRPAADGGAFLPLEIRARRATLSESLGAMLYRPGRDTLNAFSFKTIPDDEVRAVLADELGRTPRTTLDDLLAGAPPVEAVSFLLRDRLVALGYGQRADELLDTLVTGWGAWIDEAEHVRVVQWPQFVPFDIEGALAHEPIDRSRLASNVGRQAYDDIYGALTSRSEHRSDINAIVAPLRARAYGDDDAAAQDDVARIDQWYSRGRYRALALQHGCRFAGTVDDTARALSAERQGLLDVVARRRDAHRRVEIPAGLLESLANTADDEFRRLVSTSATNLEDWWSTGDPDRVARVIDALAADLTDRQGLGITQVIAAIVDHAPAAGAGVASGAFGAAVGDATVAALGGLLFTFGAGVAGSLLSSRRTPEQRRVLEAWVSRPGQAVS